VPILLFVAGVLSMLLLRRKTRALPTRDVTHIAWGRALSRGYRESDRPQWTVAELGDLAAPLALRSLDEALGPCSVSVARDERAVYVDAGATVVAVPASGAPLLQVGAFRAPAGTILVDGDLLVALLDATTAARVREGTTTIEAPEPRAVARARRTGFVGQLIADAPPEPLEIAALLVAPTIATAIGTVAPIMLHELFPFASTRGGFFVVSAAVAIALLAATHLLGRPVQVRRHGQSASHS